jgi:anti-sigma factor RsiW
MAHDNCCHLLNDLSDFLDGEASEEICAKISEHMAGCKKCRVVVDTLRKTITFYRQLPDPEMPGAIQERLYKVLDLSEFTRKNGVGPR